MQLVHTHVLRNFSNLFRGVVPNHEAGDVFEVLNDVIFELKAVGGRHVPVDSNEGANVPCGSVLPDFVEEGVNRGRG